MLPKGKLSGSAEYDTITSHRGFQDVLGVLQSESHSRDKSNMFFVLVKEQRRCFARNSSLFQQVHLQKCDH